MNYTKILIDFFKSQGLTNWYGVPDSVLNSLVLSAQKEGFSVTINVNEGASLASAIGHYLATNEVSVVFLQNSGIGNLVNPFLSLAHTDVYDIPIFFIIGGRGMMGVKDEPQHAAQGPATEDILNSLGIYHTRLLPVMDEPLLETELTKCMVKLPHRSSAIIIHRNMFESVSYKKDEEYLKNRLNREETIKLILSKHPNAYVFSTTGMISREVYESKLVPEDHLFMSVGGMGHVTSIALEFSRCRPDDEVVVLDGDGAFLMHMGTVVTEAKLAGSNLYHYILDNAAHGSVGGAPTDSTMLDYNGLAVSVGRTGAIVYDECNVSEYTPQSSMLTVFRVGTSSRKDLGRPVLNGPMGMGNTDDFTLLLVSKSFYNAHPDAVKSIRDAAKHPVITNITSIELPGTEEILKCIDPAHAYREIIAIGGGTILEVARILAMMRGCVLHVYPTTIGNGVATSGHAVYYTRSGTKINYPIYNYATEHHNDFIKSEYITRGLLREGSVDLMCHMIELSLDRRFGDDVHTRADHDTMRRLIEDYLEVYRADSIDHPSEKLYAATYETGNEVTYRFMDDYSTNLFHSASYYLTRVHHLTHAAALGCVVYYLMNCHPNLVSILHNEIHKVVSLEDLDYILSIIYHYGEECYKEIADSLNESEWKEHVASSKLRSRVILL